MAITLPADLPTSWISNQTITPNGNEAGLTTQHGYNYLMEQVNASQHALNNLSAEQIKYSNPVLLPGVSDVEGAVNTLGEQLGDKASKETISETSLSLINEINGAFTYRKNEFGEVSFDCFIYKSNSSDDLGDATIIGNLPVGFRPRRTIVIPCFAGSGSGGNNKNMANLTILTTGNIVLYTNQNMQVRQVAANGSFVSG